jgi:hypothetical protein
VFGSTAQAASFVAQARLHACDDDHHIEVDGSLADPACLSVLRRGVPALGLIHARERDHDQPLQQPVAFQRLNYATTHDKPVVVGGDARPAQFAVLVITRLVDNFSILRLHTITYAGTGNSLDLLRVMVLAFRLPTCAVPLLTERA